MNKEVIESQWTQIREILKDKFSNLSEEDIRQINGHYDQLVAKLQQKYGYTREEAEERIRSWNFDRFTTPLRSPTTAREDLSYHENKVRKEDNMSPFKWLLAIGIPILLLGAYLLSPVRTDTTTSPTVTREAIVEAPADRVISDGLRNAFIAQNMGNELQNVQITTHNGVVTLSGTVPSREVRDFVMDRTQNFSGVRQVVDNLQIR